MYFLWLKKLNYQIKEIITIKVPISRSEFICWRRERERERETILIFLFFNDLLGKISRKNIQHNCQGQQFL